METNLWGLLNPNRLRRSERGNVTITLGAVALVIVVLIIGIFVLQTFLITIMLLLVAVAVFYIFRANPYGLIAGTVIVVLAFIFAISAYGNTLSLGLAHVF